jgi:hypothetical protein
MIGQMMAGCPESYLKCQALGGTMLDSQDRIAQCPALGEKSLRKIQFFVKMHHAANWISG